MRFSGSTEIAAPGASPTCQERGSAWHARAECIGRSSSPPRGPATLRIVSRCASGSRFRIQPINAAISSTWTNWSWLSRYFWPYGNMQGRRLPASRMRAARASFAVGRAAEGSHQIILDRGSGKNMRAQQEDSAAAQRRGAVLHHHVALSFVNRVWKRVRQRGLRLPQPDAGKSDP